jgi:hypothetical protein
VVHHPDGLETNSLDYMADSGQTRTNRSDGPGEAWDPEANSHDCPLVQVSGKSIGMTYGTRRKVIRTCALGLELARRDHHLSWFGWRSTC